MSQGYYTGWVQCVSCLGRGYKGRWDNRGHRRWVLRNCSSCRGIGVRPPKESKEKAQ